MRASGSGALLSSTAVPGSSRPAENTPDEVLSRINPTVGVVEAVDDAHCVLVTGGDSVEVVAVWIGMLGLDFHVTFARAIVGTFDVDLVHEFFQGFVNHALVTLHVDNLKGTNAHHQAETAFKAFGRALRMAVEADPRTSGIPSTKGSL